MGIVRKLDAASLQTVGLVDVPEPLRSGSAATVLAQREQGYSWRSAKAELNAVYAIRSVLSDESDTLAVFQVVQKDDEGVTFVWRVLKQFPVPSRREDRSSAPGPCRRKPKGALTCL